MNERMNEIMNERMKEGMKEEMNEVMKEGIYLLIWISTTRSRERKAIIFFHGLV